MADTDQIIDDSTTSAASAKGGKKLLVLIIGAALVLGEGVGIFVVTRMMYQRPATAEAAAQTPEQAALATVEDQVELPLPEVNAFNKREGRLFLYNLEVTIIVHKDKAEDVKKILEMRKSTILDRFNTVIRSADSKYLNEPGLETLRRQFRFELDKILGDDELLHDLVIPRFYQSPADV